MQHIRHKIILIGLLVIAALTLPALTYAAQHVVLPIETLEELKTLIDQIVGAMQFVLFSIAGIFVAIAGFHFLTAQGEPDKTVAARHMILYAIYAIGAGLLAIFFADLILSFLVP